MDAIDGVHGDGDLPPVPVKTRSNMRALGQYRFARNGPADILVKGPGDNLQTTLSHEVGHLLDHYGMGTPGRLSSSAAGDVAELSEWRQAVRNSRAYRDLKDKRVNPEKYAIEVTHTWGSGRTSTFTQRPDRRFMSYLLDWEEVWARSYAQYAAESSGNTNMLRQLAEDRKDELYGWRQWESGDFAPIKQAIDNLFRGLGWLQ